MAEEKTTEVEGEILNDTSTDLEGGGDAGNSGEEKKVYTAEEVEAIRKEMQSNGDRGVQKILDEQRFKDSVIEEVATLSTNKARLIELSTENPKVANFILSKYYGGMSIEEYAEAVGVSQDDPKLQAQKVSNEAQRLYNERVITEKKEEFISKLQMTEDERQNFEEAFAERRELKSFSIEKLTSHLEKAYKEVNPVDTTDLKNAETLARATATGSGRDAGTKTAKTEAQKEVDELFSKFRLGKK